MKKIINEIESQHKHQTKKKKKKRTRFDVENPNQEQDQEMWLVGYEMKEKYFSPSFLCKSIIVNRMSKKLSRFDFINEVQFIQSLANFRNFKTLIISINIFFLEWRAFYQK